MAEQTESVMDTETDKKPAGRKGLIIGAVAAVVIGIGSGFGAVASGVVTLPGNHKDTEMAPGEIALFLPLDPVVVSLPGGERRHLTFRGEVEVSPDFAAEVEALKPRITDAMNTYLRAVDPALFDAPDALFELRGQLLRRLQVITGPDKIRDLLVMEFIVT